MFQLEHKSIVCHQDNREDNKTQDNREVTSEEKENKAVNRNENAI